MAAFTRSPASDTALSGSPTITNLNGIDLPKCVSTLTRKAFTPIVVEPNTAEMIDKNVNVKSLGAL